MSGILADAFKKPTSLDEQVESITQASYIVAVTRIKQIVANQDGYGPDQIRLILEQAQVHEVRAEIQRPAVRQALRNTLKKLTMSSKPKTSSVEVTTDQPKDPAWDSIRHTILQVRATGRAYLFGQAWLGWQLATRKAEHHKAGGGKGGDRKSMRQVGGLISWAEIVKAETGLSDRTADRFIQIFDATKAKLKRAKKDAPANKTALSILQSENPLALPPEQREAVQDVIASLCDGETQASLMRELGVVPTPPAPPPGKKTKAQKTSDEQLAFDFFDGPASAIVRARAAKDYKTLLYMLPATTDEEGKVSLVFLRDETAAMLDDINEALASHAKPAKAK